MRLLSTFLSACLVCLAGAASAQTEVEIAALRPVIIAFYTGGNSGMDVICSNGSTIKANNVEFYYYVESPSRIWMRVKAVNNTPGGGDYLLGENDTCRVTGNRSN